MGDEMTFRTSDILIGGSLIIIGLTEIAHLAGCLLGWSFLTVTDLLLAEVGIVLLAAILLSVIYRKTRKRVTAGKNDTVEENGKVVIGENDLDLAQRLIKSGSEHRKFMRQIFVSVDITGPLYWWKEFVTYKVGTTANSTSTMHKLASTPITAECFEIDDYNAELDYDGTKLGDVIDKHIEFLESMRVKYLETKDKAYWKELIRWLPSAWQQTRTVTMTYENLLAMCSKGQRRFHKLTEWSKSFIDWARTLPYAQELIFPDETE